MPTIRVTSEGPVTTVSLSRPEVKNAFDENVIREMTEAFRDVPSGARVIVLTGDAGTFCAGADANWMRRCREQTEVQNLDDARAMAEMYRAIDECAQPVVGNIRTFALGGGSGLVACCDVAIADDACLFGFTEVRLGIVPANISTFVLPRIGVSNARRYFLTGERFDARTAVAIGLLSESVPPDAVDGRVSHVVGEILKAGPAAVSKAKEIIREVPRRSREDAMEWTARTIAHVRASDEGQEGLSAFLEKRRPRWSA